MRIENLIVDEYDGETLTNDKDQKKNNYTVFDTEITTTTNNINNSKLLNNRPKNYIFCMS